MTQAMNNNPVLQAAQEARAALEQEEQKLQRLKEEELKRTLAQLETLYRINLAEEFAGKTYAELFFSRLQIVTDTDTKTVYALFSEETLEETNEDITVWKIRNEINYGKLIWKFIPGRMVKNTHVHDSLRISWKSCNQQELAQTLFVEIARYHELLVTREQEYARQERVRSENAQRDSKQREEQVQREREQEQHRLSELALAREEDARHHTTMESLVEEKRKQMWTWPEGVNLTYYEMQYQKGSLYIEDTDETVYDYKTYYTLCDALELSTGRILVSKRNGDKTFQEMTLDMRAHRPTWTRMKASSVKELPGMLVQEVTVTLPNVQHQFLRDEEGKEPIALLKQYPEESYGIWSNQVQHSQDYTETVGFIPVQEIQDEVDRLARHQPNQ